MRGRRSPQPCFFYAIDVEARTSKKIHLLLTDVVMPGINGRVLAERLHLKQREMKVLYISGYTDSFIASHGVLERGMTLLNKPYTEDELVQKVRETLRRRAGEGNDESDLLCGIVLRCGRPRCHDERRLDQHESRQ